MMRKNVCRTWSVVNLIIRIHRMKIKPRVKIDFHFQPGFFTHITCFMKAFMLKRLIKRLSCLKCLFRSSPPELFYGKDILKICSRFTGQHRWRSVISIKLQSNFIEITLRYGFYPVNLLHIFRTSLYKNTCGGLFICQIYFKYCPWKLDYL